MKKRLSILAVILLFVVGISIIAIRNFKIPVFYLDDYFYKRESTNEFGLGIFFLIFGLINIKFYKFFFYLQNSLWVKDPEPTEAYKAVSIGGGIVVCAIGMIFMIANCGQL